MTDIYSILAPWAVVLIWTAAISWAYKDNRVFRMTTVAIVAGGAANGILVNINSVYTKGILPILDGTKILAIIPLIFGLMLASVFFSGRAWISRYPSVLMMGISMGALVTGVIGAQILGQISDTMTGFKPGTDAIGVINAFLVLIGVVCSLLYFTYGKEQTGALSPIIKVGRYFLLASLGPFWAGELSFHMSFGIVYIQNIIAALRTILPI
jgi:hypothetical protein